MSSSSELMTMGSPAELERADCDVGLQGVWVEF